MIEKELESIEYTLYQNEFLQVMLNLIKNAVDSIALEGKVTIKLFSREGKVFITVEDNGSGIDEKLLAKVFDPYFTTKNDSMGLGLYMSKMIIEDHCKGTLSVENSDAGACFKIDLGVKNG